MKRLLVIAMLGMLLLAGCLCPPCPTCEPTATVVVPTATPVVERPLDEWWHHKLTEHNVSFVRNGRYELIYAWTTHNGSWDGLPVYAKPWQRDTLGGDTHAYGICLDVDGNILYDKTFSLSWPDGAAGFTPEPDGWANAFLGGGGSLYYPDQGQSGPFTWGPLNSDKLVGLGLPYNQHYSFFGVWKARW